MPDAESANPLRTLLSGTLPPDEERRLVVQVLEQEPQLAPQLIQLYLQHKLRLQTSLGESVADYTCLRETLARSTWAQSILLKILPGPPARALVARGSRRLLTSVDPNIDPRTLQRGQTVYVNDENNCLVQAGEREHLPGVIGTFLAMEGSRALIQGAQDERWLMDCLDLSLPERLRSGDRVVYDQDSRLVLERIVVPEVSLAGIRLEEAPAISFDQIGGLEEIVDSLTQEIRLHLFHRDVVARHRMPFQKGILLYGPPGCGKTLLAGAVARYVSDLEGVDGRFLTIKAGSHRSMWYGQSEERLREAFGLVRRAAASGQFVTVLFDDFDHFGSRDATGHDVDARILPALLHEVDSLQAVPGVFLIGVTNRPDLLDEALLRPGRFGDRTFTVPRPNRAAATAIFKVHLPTALSYRADDDMEPECRDRVIARAVSCLYAPNGELGQLGWLTFRDGSRRPLTSSQLMSGALIAGAITEAKRRSCFRTLQGRSACIVLDDLLDGLRQELLGVASRLKPGSGLKRLLDLPSDLDVVKIEITAPAQGAGPTPWIAADLTTLTAS